jgi:hypothetical protein
MVILFIVCLLVLKVNGSKTRESLSISGAGNPLFYIVPNTLISSLPTPPQGGEGKNEFPLL